MWNRLSLVQAANPIVTRDELKRHLYIDHDEDDQMLDGMLAAAVAYICGPNGIGIALGHQRWRLSLDRLETVEIPLGPIVSVDAITIDGLTVSPDSYYFDCGWLHVDQNQYAIQRRAGVQVEFTCGYDPVPADLRIAILMIASHLYANRESTSPVSMTVVPHGVDAILSRYRRY